MVMQNVIDCNDCECTGWEKNEFICEDCDGKKIAFDKKTINIDIEKGSPDGYRFTFFGEGDQAPKAQNGDLIIELVIKKHQYFRREGADIYYKQDLSLLEAISGFKKIIPTLDKMENLLIETTTIVQHGEVKVITGRGLPFFNSPKRYGNMFIEFIIIFPSFINEEKLKLVEDLLSERYHSIDKKVEEEKESYVLSNFNLKISNTLDPSSPKYSKNKPKSEDVQKHFQKFLKPKGDGVKPEHRALAKEQPRHIAGSQPEQHEPRNPVALGDPGQKDCDDCDGSAPPDQRVADCGDGRRAAGSATFVKEGGWANHEQPGERVCRVRVTRGEVDVKVVCALVVLPEGDERVWVRSFAVTPVADKPARPARQVGCEGQWHGH